MSEKLKTAVKKICGEHGNDRTRMMDIVRAVQKEEGCISGPAMDAIAQATGAPRVEVEGVATFYSFFSEEPKGKTVIRHSNCVVCNLWDDGAVTAALKKELGIDYGQTTPDGAIGLTHTACIGMCDQGPAALVGDVVVTRLSTDKVRDMVVALKATGDPKKLVKTLGDGANAKPIIHAMVQNNIRKRGEVIFSPQEPGVAIKNALGMTPAEVIRNVKTARLRGRGGAGFPTGMKWEFARAASGANRFVICNADEGEPGTFKDRVILTECPDLLFEGMTIAGYAIDSTQGILYLRGEYNYLRPHLEEVLAGRRKKGLLGKNIMGRMGFDFDIRIQMGAGAYVCGEETALISSCEGQRGEPKQRPPFPAQKGYMELPTIVNNVETLCCAARILEKGAPWFASTGSKGSSGLKLFSVSGDCDAPGVYELPYGITVKDLLKEVGGENAAAVQIGGPSGQCIGPDSFGRTLCYDDLATGGAIMVFGPDRDLLAVASRFMEFFIEESCGWCTPCRVGNVLLKERLDKIRAGFGGPEDIPYLEELGKTVKVMSRCGLGQTSANPVLTTLKNFPHLYQAKFRKVEDGMQPTFDIDAALGEAVRVQGRNPVHFD